MTRRRDVPALAVGLFAGLAAAACAAGRPAPADATAAKEEPVLLGRMTGDEVLHHAAKFEQGYATYEPDPGPVGLIASIEEPLTIEVLWGSWCSDSEREVPHFAKILAAAQAQRDLLGLGPLPIEATFLAVDREKREPADLLEGKFLEKVPTFIVRRGDREVGRVVETPQGLLEEDLAVLVLEAAAPAP